MGTENFLKGHVLFSKNFKTVTKQGYTFFENLGAKSRIYFEGILDFLSFLMIYPEQELLHDYCILNSVNNLKMTFENLPSRSKTDQIHTKVLGFLDRDVAGDKATSQLKYQSERQGAKFYDYRSTFKGKDLNDFLLGKY